jgi:hypothetical protein
MVVHAIFDKNGGCVAIDLHPDAHTSHPTYLSFPYIIFLDFRWRPFHGQKSVGVKPSVLLKIVVHGYFRQNLVVWPLIIDQRLVHLTPKMFSFHRSHSSIFGGDHFLVKNP